LNFRESAIDLELLQYAPLLRWKEQNNASFVFDPIRKKYYAIQPEETVRQLLLLWFLDKTIFNAGTIRVEKQIQVNDLQRRFDIVVYDNHVQPLVIVECKSPDVTIDQKSFDQISAYNSVMGAPYMMVSNGIQTWITYQDKSTRRFVFISSLPKWMMKEQKIS